MGKVLVKSNVGKVLVKNNAGKVQEKNVVGKVLGKINAEDTPKAEIRGTIKPTKRRSAERLLVDRLP
ncbi:hypothetical protein MA47_08960 [Corynebacterium auriscanis]|uniref:Uncharacterized protein n=1 Tax=Corynebacterium auriscanis TaxID=99807 RepID=A0A0A2DMS7_9CORY|nr:hypothetical protein MA47_08960 [Corynebacterium auriscanis]